MPIIEACVDGSEFWSNKIRSEFRGKDTNQIAFCNNFKAFLVELMECVSVVVALGGRAVCIMSAVCLCHVVRGGGCWLGRCIGSLVRCAQSL